MRALPLFALLPILVAPWAPARGDTPPDEAPGEEQIVELRLNGQETGATLLVRRDASGVLFLRAEDFAALRLRPPQVATVLVDGIAYFRIDASLGADVRFDGATQSVDIALPADAFVPTVTGKI
jgi:outer membrane usher protein FimD/PapC